MPKAATNQINPAKLLLSKWTAVVPNNKLKHYMVTKVNKDEMGVVKSCTLEAVLTKKEVEYDWRELKDKTRWLAGWH